jgi:hypothetical protein
VKLTTPLSGIDVDSGFVIVLLRYPYLNFITFQGNGNGMLMYFDKPITPTLMYS